MLIKIKKRKLANQFWLICLATFDVIKIGKKYEIHKSSLPSLLLFFHWISSMFVNILNMLNIFIIRFANESQTEWVNKMKFPEKCLNVNFYGTCIIIFRVTHECARDTNDWASWAKRFKEMSNIWGLFAPVRKQCFSVFQYKIENIFFVVLMKFCKCEWLWRLTVFLFFWNYFNFF